MTIIIQKILNAIQKCLSDNGAVSFGRTMSALWSFYFMGTDSWLFHRTGSLVDDATLLTQLTVITSFYGVTKVGQMVNRTGTAQPTLEQSQVDQQTK